MPSEFLTPSSGDTAMNRHCRTSFLELPDNLTATQAGLDTVVVARPEESAYLPVRRDGAVVAVFLPGSPSSPRRGFGVECAHAADNQFLRHRQQGAGDTTGACSTLFRRFVPAITPKRTRPGRSR
jgi:hypothetical protein